MGRKAYPFSARARAELARVASAPVVDEEHPGGRPASYGEIARHLHRNRLTRELVDRRIIWRACHRLGVR